MSPLVVLAAALGIGLMSGLRAFTPVALVSWLAIWGWMPVSGSRFWFIGTEAFAIVISVLAVIELIGDKLPGTPARTQLMPLIARLVTGAMSGGAVSFSAGRPWLVGSLLGTAGSVMGAFSGYHIRRVLVARCRIPDFIVALCEDFVTIAGTLFIVHTFFSAQV